MVDARKTCSQVTQSLEINCVGNLRNGDPSITNTSASHRSASVHVPLLGSPRNSVPRSISQSPCRTHHRFVPQRSPDCPLSCVRCNFTDEQRPDPHSHLPKIIGCGKSYGNSRSPLGRPHTDGQLDEGDCPRENEGCCYQEAAGVTKPSPSLPGSIATPDQSTSIVKLTSLPEDPLVTAGRRRIARQKSLLGSRHQWDNFADTNKAASGSRDSIDDCDACPYCDDICDSTNCVACFRKRVRFCIRKGLLLDADFEALPRTVEGAGVGCGNPTDKQVFETQPISSDRLWLAAAKPPCTFSKPQSHFDVQKRGNDCDVGDLETGRETVTAGTVMGKQVASEAADAVKGKLRIRTLIQNLSRSRIAKLKHEFTPCEVERHRQETDCWLIVERYAYDITDVLPLHPAGPYCILQSAGQDASVDFKYHSTEAQQVWKTYRVGLVVPCEGRPSSKLLYGRHPVYQFVKDAAKQADRLCRIA